MAEVVIDRSCGPEGCKLDWLASPRVEVDPDNPKIVTTVRGVGYRAGAVV